MLIDESEIKNLIQIKKILRIERYKKIFCLIVSFLVLVFHLLDSQLETAFIMVSFVSLVELVFSTSSRRLLCMYEKIIDSDVENIKTYSKLKS